MILAIAGLFLLALGLFCGAVLVLVPMGLVAWTADAVLWVLFPLFSLAGYALVVMASKSANAKTLTMVASVFLLLMAAASALGLVLGAASITSSGGSSLQLWYVLAVAGVLGLVGVASYGRSESAA